MSEPITRRTQSGQAEENFRPLKTPLARVLSLCGVLSVCALVAGPVAAADTASTTVYAIESVKAKTSLLTDITQAGSRLVAVGERGHILYSDDQGTTRQQAKVPSLNLLTSVYFADDKNGWAVGHDALILRTSDGGQSWTEQYKDLEREEGAPFLDVWFANANHGFVVGAYGALLETTDGGSTWEDVSYRLENDDGYHLNALAAVKDAGLMVVGEMGVIFRSSDLGQTWEKVEGPYEGSLFGLQATDQSAGVVVYGLRGNIFHSADFGSSWQASRVNTARGEFEIGLAGSALAQDGSIALVGHGGAVLTSTDGGKSFNAVIRADRLSLSSVATDAQGNLVLVGQGGVRVASPTGTAPGQQ